jgi:S1-C subfamily serine protease
MADKIYCDKSVKWLLWTIAILFIATIVGMIYYPDAVEIETSASCSPSPLALPESGSLNPAKTARSIARVARNSTAGVSGSAQPAALAVNPNAPALSRSFQSTQGHLNSVATSVKPSVVHIHVLRVVPAEGMFGSTQVDSIGSGVIVDPRGYVLTNYHVVENPLRISVTTYSQAGSDTYQAELIDSDARADLAVIQMQGGNFPSAVLGDSSSLQVGDWVMAMGSPLDLAQTVSLGIVSAVRGAVRIGDVTYFDLIQTDAHINKGNSGGPLVDMYGQVVGINAAIYTPEGRFTGVGFALPINSAQGLLSDLGIGQNGPAGAR